MVRIIKEVGRNRDLPQLESINLNSQAGAGSGADYEHAIVTVPNLGLNATAGSDHLRSDNTMTIRQIYLIFEAALTGVNTNNVTYNVLQRRAGTLLVNAYTSVTTITAGVNVVTPSSMANIYNGQQLTFSGGTGATETVTVYNVTGTTFTANFANGHSGGYAINSAPLMTITYSSGVNEVAYVPHFFNVTAANYIKPGDVVTIQRVSSGTGLATPALTVGLDWVSAGPQ